MISVEELGNLSIELINERTKNEDNKHLTEVLSGKIFISSFATGGESGESFLHVRAVFDDETIELSGEEDHTSGIQHEPSYNGRILGDGRLEKIRDQPTIIQLATLYTLKGNKSFKVEATSQESYGSWEGMNNDYWEVNFTFPELKYYENIRKSSQ